MTSRPKLKETEVLLEQAETQRAQLAAGWHDHDIARTARTVSTVF